MKPNINNFIKQYPTSFDLLAIILVWTISLFFVNPIGNFPLNDDWAYNITVKHLVENGVYRPSDWANASLISQVLWGALFCIPFGFSFTALRISTLVISLMGVIGIYLIFKSLNLPRKLGIIAALLLGYNPIYFALSNTFMTDVPFTSMTIFAFLFLIRSLKNNAIFDLLLGSIFACFATLNRQIGIFIPIAFMCTGFFKFKFNIRWFIRVLFPLILCLGVSFSYQHWLLVTGRTPWLLNRIGLEIFKTIPSPQFVFTNLYVALLYLGWFAFPLLIFTLLYLTPALFKKHFKKILFILGLVACGFFLIYLTMPNVFWLINRQMPISGNIIIRKGIGPLILRDVFAEYLPSPDFSYLFWGFITVISMFGGVLLIITISKVAYNLIIKIRASLITPIAPSLLVEKEGDEYEKNKLLEMPVKHHSLNEEQLIMLFLLFSVIIYILPLLAMHITYFALGFYDRYLIGILPIIIILTSFIYKQYFLPNNKLWILLSELFLLFFFIFSVSTTKDYLELNRTRWKATDYLLYNQHVSPREIDGGFEFNGLYLYSRDYLDKPGKSWWWVDDDKYIIAFGGIPEYSIFREYDYFHLLPPCNSKIFILKSDK